MEVTRELVFMGGVSRALARGDRFAAFDLLVSRYPRHLALRILDEFVALEPVHVDPELVEEEPPPELLVPRPLERTGIRVGAPAKRPSQPPRRQLEVLRWVAEGDDNAAIALRLSISEETVKSHLRKLLPRLGARNRAHAVALAFRDGFLAFELR